ncbi:MAG: hypothetical protein JO001_16390 [Alphaproteobacteria bacterium]|nr:hypothetical protein [Alphaproteobacteria bacterium]
MSDIDTRTRPSTETGEFELPLPEPIVLGTEATKAVAGGLIRPTLCTTCGLMQPFPVEKLA